MKKNARISDFVSTLATEGQGLLDPHYVGFFVCFNRGQYYEAHDVLEHLWLRTDDDHGAFFKGLIQVAGAFVHLQKQFLRPDHPKDGRRLHPAVRLFKLGMRSTAPFAPHHLQLNVLELNALCQHMINVIICGDFSKNPWHPDELPQMRLLDASR